MITPFLNFIFEILSLLKTWVVCWNTSVVVLKGNHHTVHVLKQCICEEYRMGEAWWHRMHVTVQVERFPSRRSAIMLCQLAKCDTRENRQCVRLSYYRAISHILGLHLRFFFFPFPIFSPGDRFGRNKIPKGRFNLSWAFHCYNVSPVGFLPPAFPVPAE